MSGKLPTDGPRLDADQLGDQLLPILEAAGFTYNLTPMQSPDGRWQVHTNNVVLPGRGQVVQLLATDLIERNGYQERPIVLRAVVADVDHAVSLLRAYGVLPQPQVQPRVWTGGALEPVDAETVTDRYGVPWHRDGALWGMGRKPQIRWGWAVLVDNRGPLLEARTLAGAR